ncbi:MAG TPA: hypothetical protein VKE94_17885, partial [Gemmataceae bacterium]|nr:hypothetical protein [Gemmataceae bacterium]
VAVIAVVIVAGLGVVFYQFYWSPYRTKEANLAQLKKQTEQKESRVAEIAAQRPQLERYRQASLPADMDLAKREYQRYLEGLLRESGFGQISVADRKAGGRGVPTLANKTPVYTPLGFTVTGRATFESLVKMMEKFYRTGLLHQIKTLSIARPKTTQPGQRQNELDISLTVDALVVQGADKRATLMPTLDKRLQAADAFAAMSSGPTGLGLVLWSAGPFGPHGPGVLAEPERDYGALTAKNIFFGPPVRSAQGQNQTQLEALRFTTLNEISVDHGRIPPRYSAMLYDVSSNDKSRLRTLGGFNTFPLVRNSQGITLVHGEVLKIDERSLVFRVGLNASDPEDKIPYYTDREKIYHVNDKDLEVLVRDGLARTDDASRVFWMDKGRWDYLIADKMVTVVGRAFAFKWDLVKGFVLRDDGQSVFLRIDDKYCAYRYDENSRPQPPHEGYCTLRIGGSVAEALRTPLKNGEIKELTAKAP